MWELVKSLAAFIGNIFSKGENESAHTVGQKLLPELWFRGLTIVEKTPGNALIAEKQFYVVRHRGNFLWTLFKCPCGCGEVVSLPLQPPHTPKWRVSTTEAQRPTLYPSVWRNKGCMSHFWIEDGRVFWTADSGVAPWIAKPELYNRNSQRRVDFKA